MNDHVSHRAEPVDLLARQALFAFASAVTVPLVVLGKDKEPPYHRGTGVLFTARGRYFLITAEHVLKDQPIGRMAIVPRGRRDKLAPFGKVGMWLPQDQRFDVGYLEFLEPDSIERIRSTYRFVGPENIGNANLDSDVFLCGFPDKQIDISGKRVTGEPLFVDSTPLKSVPKGLNFDLVPGLEMFAAYGRRGYSPETGVEIDTPDLTCTSGCGVWQYTPPASGIWTPERAVRLVAVQNSFRHSEFFRAMTWSVVHQGLHSFAPDVARDIYEAVFPGAKNS